MREAGAVAPATRTGETRAAAGRSSRMRRRPTAIVPAESSSAGLLCHHSARLLS